MQKITRIFVSRYGTATAWYENTPFEFVDPVTHEPINAIVNLENTGGKTSLLAYIFSIFDPRRDKFIQHAQNTIHQFEDYFLKDGKVSFILVEWSMPSRIPGGKDYKLVVGQAVALRDVIDRGSAIDRIFFSFEPQHGITFDDVPAQGLGMGLQGINTMTEFTQWVMQMHKKSPADFYYTRQQNEWTEHLSTSRLIDLDLLVMQRQFNSQEGGLESGFLSFQDEEDLIRKLMSLTMDAGRAKTVRDTVAVMTDKAQKKPRLEARLKQFENIIEQMKPLGSAAQVYRQAAEEQSVLVRKAAGLSAAMELARSSEARRVGDLSVALDSLLPRLTEMENQRVSSQAQILSMEGLQKTRSVLSAASLLEAEIAKEQNAKSRMALIDGAISFKKVEGARRQVEIEEQTLQEEIEGLRPIRERVERQGALLRAAIDALLSELASKQQQAQAAVTKARLAIEQAKSERNRLSGVLKSLNSESATLQAQIESAENERNRLLDEQVLDPFDHDACAAVARLTIQIDENKAQLAALADERACYEKSALTLREQASQYEMSAQSKDNERANHAKRLNEARDLRESLEHNRLLCSLSESELCDPDSLALLGRVKEYLISLDQEVIDREIHLAQLRQRRASIDETGLAGKSDDVDQVVSFLKSAGISSAQATNTYIADLVDDVLEARRLVVSDPARFLGVTVANGEWPAARKALAKSGLKLSAPVTVATASLEEAVSSIDRVVLPAEDDSAFNRAAASDLLDDFDRKQREIEDKRNEYVQRRVEARAVLVKLEGYLETFGASVMAEIEDVIEGLILEKKALVDSKAECVEEADRFTALARQAELKREPLPSAIAKLENHVKRLEDFARYHEAPLTQRTARLSEVKAEISRCEQQDQAHVAAIEEHDSAVRSAQDEQAQLMGESEKLRIRKTATTYYLEGYDCTAELAGGFNLQVLADTYDNDRGVYEADEASRLGVRRTRLEQLRKIEESLTEAHQAEHSQLSEEDILRVLCIDLALERKSLVDSLRVYGADVLAANRLHAAALNSQESFFKQHAPDEPAEDIEQLNDEQIEYRIKGLLELIEQLIAAIEAAREEASKAKADKLKAQARIDSLAKNKNTLDAAIPSLGASHSLFEIEGDGYDQLNALIKSNGELKQNLDAARMSAQAYFAKFTKACQARELAELDPNLSTLLLSNSFEEVCGDFEALLDILEDRIDTARTELEELTPDFERCVGEVHQLVEEGLSILKKACDVLVPKGAPYVAGKAIMKMRSPLAGLSTEDSRGIITSYLNSLVESRVVPEQGADLVAAGMINLSRRRTFGLQLLQMEQNPDHQYQDAGRLKKSGGQGVVIAMFIYLMLSQLRKTQQTVTKRGGGCPLILDNPFAKVQTRALIDVQIMLAEAIGVQLIFFTAMKDVNILAGFQKVIRLRKFGVKNGLSHIQIASADFNTDIQRPSPAHE